MDIQLQKRLQFNFKSILYQKRLQFHVQIHHADKKHNGQEDRLEQQIF